MAVRVRLDPKWPRFGRFLHIYRYYLRQNEHYLAFDTELVVQSGCRLFRTDEAIISPDWVSNENLICSYDSVNREFAWINRPYELTRVGYNAKMKEHRDKNTPKSEALSMSPYANARIILAKHVLIRFNNFILSI